MHQSGNVPGAEQGYQSLLRQNPNNADALHYYGILAHQTGRQDVALDLMDKAVRLAPSNPALNSNRGEVLRALGRLDDARQAYVRATRLAPDFADAWLNLALVLVGLERFSDAERAAKKCVRLAPQALEAHMALAETLWVSYDYKGARVACAKALEVDRGCWEAALKAGLCASALADRDDARRWFERVLDINPNQTEALLALADMHLGASDPTGALAHLEAIEASEHADPSTAERFGHALFELECYIEALPYLLAAMAAPGIHDEDLARRELLTTMLGWCEAQCGDLDAGVTRLRTLAEVSGRAVPLQSLGRLLALNGRTEQAAEAFAGALERDPNANESRRGHAEMVIAMGDFTRARKLLADCVAADSSDGFAHESLASITRPADWTDSQRAHLDSLAKDANLAIEERASALFAAGKLFDDEDDRTRAFDRMRRANGLMRELVPYDPVAHDRWIDRIIATFTDTAPPSQLARIAGPQPVFIVGMPRSGTSLIEQILASHPDARGVGEVEFFAHIRFTTPGAQSYPEGALALDDATVTALAERYLGRLRDLAGVGDEPAPPRVITDKMPGNFLYLGLIRRLFPNAHIVHSRREPMAVGLSNFFQNFTAAAGNAYAYDLADIGHYIRGYQRLMNHWRGLLGDSLLDVDYESLVTDPRAEVERLLAHVGLDWDDQCLAFHKSRRGVHTASSFQVRQPLYTRSVARWQDYAEELKPLKIALTAESADP